MRLNFLLRRLFTSFIVIVGVVTLTFFAARILPGDPAQLYAGWRARPDQLVAVRVKLGLDRPLPQQFIHYVGTLLQGDWGVSFKTKRTVAEDLRIFLPATLELVLLGFAVAVSLGILLGVLSSAWEGRSFDRFGSILAIVGASMPVFWMALLGQQLFFNQLGWLPLNGRLDAQISMNYPVQSLSGFLLVDSALTGNWPVWWDALAHLILPAMVVAAYPLCIIYRMTRNTMVEALHEPHIMTARARGLPQHILLLRHALPNALLPTLTISGLTFAYTITGSVLVELLFRWPGVGKYVADAIVSRDFPVILAVTLVGTIIYVLVNFAIDVMQIVLDPRMR